MSNKHVLGQQPAVYVQVASAGAVIQLMTLIAFCEERLLQRLPCMFNLYKTC